MTKKLTEAQIKILKTNIDEMAKSEEQFIFMFYKNKDGADDITCYGYAMSRKKLDYFMKKELGRGSKKEEGLK